MHKVPEATLFARMLVPLDGSPNAESILYQAHQLLCGKKSEVVLFHVLEPAPSGASPAFASPEVAETYLKGIEHRLTPFGARVRRVLRSGPLEAAMLETIHSEKISLVALSSHGRRTEAERPVAGSVETIVRASNVPVFIARAFQRNEDGALVPARCEPSNIRRILVPLDGSSESEAVIPYARELGQLLDALIVILHVDSERQDGSRDLVGTRRTGAVIDPTPGKEATPDERLAFAASLFSAVGLETMTLNLSGDPLSTILGFARPSAVDLIALTTHGRSGLTERLIGSLAHQVLQDSVLPTLLVSLKQSS
jgi:nucleotide-binding universal stress UspA family protein